MRLRSRVALARTVLSFAAVSYFRTRAALDRVAPHATAPLCARLGAHAVAVATVALGAACGAELADEEVGLDVPHVTATVTCTPTDGATVRGDSPDGELWLAQGATTIVIAADGTRRALPWRIDDATALYPTSAGAAAAVIGGEVWTLDDGAREVVPTPTALGAAAAVCGPPSAEHGTFIATAKEACTHRSAARGVVDGNGLHQQAQLAATLGQWRYAGAAFLLNFAVQLP